MRKRFVEYLENQVEKNPNIILVTADLGYGLFDSFKEKYPNNFINCGSSEQLMIGMCVGLSYTGKIPIAYSITPFIVFRPMELIRNYVNREKLNIKLVASGRDKDYSHDGFTHWGHDDDILKYFENIQYKRPEDENELIEDLHSTFSEQGPVYLNLSKRIL
jgi:transketolase